MATAPQSFASLPQISSAVAAWVESVRQLTTPDQVQWCDGSAAELARLKQGLEKSGELKQLNQKTFPGCHIAYSQPSDVARVEHLTFICTKNREDAGPNNNWMDPAEARAKIVYERLIRFTDDPGTIRALQFLMTREITHMKAFTAALESMGVNRFSIGSLPPTPDLVNQYFDDSTGTGDRGEPNARGPWNTGGDWQIVDAPAFKELESQMKGTRQPNGKSAVTNKAHAND